MTLKHIPDEVCPHCKAPANKEELGWTHTNGTRQEWRTFECGARLHYVPNFGRVEQATPCPNDPQEITKHTERKALVQQLVAVVRAGDIDEDFRGRCLRLLEMWI
jgi:hypothetical protein